ncbi:MAG: hypothetical protein LBR53_12595 [Deltaproteobacteria bacterium]|nr:hypothetical protein [Deltaproteobacteria bacterium]
MDGIDTGVRQQIRTEPLETAIPETPAGPITVPAEAEIPRIKAILILKRNAARDYVDFAALAERLDGRTRHAALASMDRLHPRDTGESPLQRLLSQLANPAPFDPKRTDLSEYKRPAPRLRDWDDVKRIRVESSLDVFERL